MTISGQPPGPHPADQVLIGDLTNDTYDDVIVVGTGLLPSSGHVLAVVPTADCRLTADCWVTAECSDTAACVGCVWVGFVAAQLAGV